MEEPKECPTSALSVGTTADGRAKAYMHNTAILATYGLRLVCPADTVISNPSSSSNEHTGSDEDLDLNRQRDEHESNVSLVVGITDGDKTDTDVKIDKAVNRKLWKMARAICQRNLRRIKTLMGPAPVPASAPAPSDQGQDQEDRSESRHGKFPQLSVPRQLHVPRMFFVFEPFYIFLYGPLKSPAILRGICNLRQHSDEEDEEDEEDDRVNSDSGSGAYEECYDDDSVTLGRYSYVSSETERGDDPAAAAADTVVSLYEDASIEGWEVKLWGQFPTLVPASAPKVENNSTNGHRGKNRDKSGDEEEEESRSCSVVQGMAWRCESIEHIIQLCQYETTAYRLAYCDVTVQVPATDTIFSSAIGAGANSFQEAHGPDPDSDIGSRGIPDDGEVEKGMYTLLVLKNCRTFVSNVDSAELDDGAFELGTMRAHVASSA